MIGPTIPNAVAVTLSFCGNHRDDTIGGREASISPTFHIYLVLRFWLSCLLYVIGYLQALQQRCHRGDMLQWTISQVKATAWYQVICQSLIVISQGSPENRCWKIELPDSWTSSHEEACKKNGSTDAVVCEIHAWHLTTWLHRIWMFTSPKRQVMFPQFARRAMVASDQEGW